jgi:hypothetical protein
MKYKEESYPWRLYAMAQPHGGSSQIKKPHNCRRPPGDRKHLQLTSNLIAGYVRQYLKKYISLTVQQINMIIATKYLGVAPTYNKL